MNLVAFFMCGLPGGLDYIMLALVKLGRLDPLAEKARAGPQPPTQGLPSRVTDMS